MTRKKSLALEIPVLKCSSEKAKTFLGRFFFAPALNHFPVARRGQVRKRTAFQHSARIFFEQRGSQILAFCFLKQVEHRFQAQRARVHIVRVAGDEVNRVCVKQEFRGFLCAATESAGERLRSYLREAALAQPSPEAFPLGTDQRVAFGMGDYQLEAHQMEMVKRLLDRSGDGEVVELDEKI